MSSGEVRKAIGRNGTPRRFRIGRDVVKSGANIRELRLQRRPQIKSCPINHSLRWRISFNQKSNSVKIKGDEICDKHRALEKRIECGVAEIGLHLIFPPANSLHRRVKSGKQTEKREERGRDKQQSKNIVIAS